MKEFLYGLMMLIFFQTVIAGGSADSPFTVDEVFAKTEQAKQDDSIRYKGRAAISGKYIFTMVGELEFVLSKESVHLLPHPEEYMDKGGEVEIFIGGDQAIKKLALSDAINKIDGEHYCGFEGKARIEITDLYSDGFEDKREFSAKLVRILRMQRPTFFDCSKT